METTEKLENLMNRTLALESVYTAVIVELLGTRPNGQAILGQARANSLITLAKLELHLPEKSKALAGSIHDIATKIFQDIETTLKSGPP